MPSVTIKDIPEDLMDQLRLQAKADKRSLNREVIHLLGLALTGGFEPDDTQRRSQAALRQAEAWERLAGTWQSDRAVEEEIAAIYSARSQGRDVEL